MIVPGLIQKVHALVTGPDQLLRGHSVGQELGGQEGQSDLLQQHGQMVASGLLVLFYPSRKYSVETCYFHK